MKRIVIAVLLLVSAATAFGQEKTDDTTVTTKDLKSRIFDIHYRDPHDLMNAITLLGSGMRGANMSYNQDMHTITVRDFPENLASIQDAIARLDKPVAAAPDVELKISILLGSKSDLSGAVVPPELENVVKQLQSTLRYSHYGLMTTGLHRATTAHGSVEGSGVADAAMLGVSVKEGQPVFYSYTLSNISIAEPASINIRNFKFSMRLPIRTGTESFQYQAVGFETPVTLKPNEKVVIGTTTLGDKALVVVVNATLPAAQ